MYKGDGLGCVAVLAVGFVVLLAAILLICLLAII